MQKFIDYKILPEKNLIIEYFRGVIELQDFFDIKTRESNNPEYKATLNLIVDYTDAVIPVNEALVKQFVEFLRQSSKLFGKRKSAYITSNAFQVVVTTMFEINKQDLPINSKVVSTLEEAVKWVDVPLFEYDQVEKKFEELKNEAIRWEIGSGRSLPS
jgi:hypothetical protein